MERIALVKAQDIQELFGVTGQTVTNWIEAGDLPQPIRMGKLRYWLREEILEVLNSRNSGTIITQEKLNAHLDANENENDRTQIPA